MFHGSLLFSWYARVRNNFPRTAGNPPGGRGSAAGSIQILPEWVLIISGEWNKRASRPPLRSRVFGGTRLERARKEDIREDGRAGRHGSLEFLRGDHLVVALRRI